MRRRSLLVPMLCVIFHASVSVAQGKPALYAYVTRVASSGDFDVDGLRALISAKTVLQARTGKVVSSLANPAPFVGQMANLWGRVDRKALTISVSRMELIEPGPEVISGSAIIDLLPSSPPDVHRLRADGRLLEISQDVLDHPVRLSAGAIPPASDNDLQTNVWIEYHGLRSADGVVALDQATFTENKIGKSEAAYRQKQDYDPAAIPQTAHQSGASRSFKGADPKQIPPFKDTALQERIERIARSLIPAFQRALAMDDPARIDFRFQLVDEPKWHDAMALSSGIILVPKQIVVRLTDDSELAAVLADNIASALEKQSYRQVGARHAITAAALGGIAADVLVPGAGIVTGIATKDARGRMLSAAEQQSGRVALALMFDAGFDIDKAPEAWWVLATKDGQNPHAASPPDRAANQLDELGTTWQPSNRDRLTVERPVKAAQKQ